MRVRQLGRRSLGVAAAILALAVALVLAFPVRRYRADAALLRGDPERSLADPAVRARVLPAGRAIYLAHCAACHGEAGKGDPRIGVPDLTGDAHLYDLGSVAQIEDIARFGIRSGNKRGWDLAAMPAYASRVPYAREPLPPLSPAEIEDATQFVLWFTARATDPAAARRGRTLFQGKGGCWDCHGQDAGGDQAIGAPTLSDDAWVYGSAHDDIYRSIARGRAGYSPAFGHLLRPIELREVALYVASLTTPARARTTGR